MKKRTHRLCTTQKYRTIWEVASIEEFKKAFVDVIECHHYAYKLGLLPYLSPPREVVDNADGSNVGEEDAHSRASIGVLNDWEFGMEVDCSSPIPTERTNRPFEARDHLLYRTREVARNLRYCYRHELEPFICIKERQIHRQHRYRHDLESFLYILIWVMIHCDLANKRELKTHYELKCWEMSTSMPRVGEKEILLDAYRYYRNKVEESGLWEDVQAPFSPLWHQWFGPLLSMHWNAEEAVCHSPKGVSLGPMELMQSTDDAWQETLGGRVTYEKYIEILRGKKGVQKA